MKSIGIIRVGGVALVTAALSFTAVFLYLASRFNYPEVLDAPAAEALPGLLAMGATGRAVWAIYGFLPLLLIPAAMGAYAALQKGSEWGMRMAALLAMFAAMTMMLGLLRWPTIQWELAQAYANAGQDGRTAIVAVFDGLNSYLGNYIGEFAGELCLNAFFALSGRAMLRSNTFPKWMGWLGIASGMLGWIGMWRNVTGAVAIAAELDNTLLPLWMVIFGIGLIRVRAQNHGPISL